MNKYYRVHNYNFNKVYRTLQMKILKLLDSLGWTSNLGQGHWIQENHVIVTTGLGLDPWPKGPEKDSHIPLHAELLILICSVSYRGSDDTDNADTRNMLPFQCNLNFFLLFFLVNITDKTRVLHAVTTFVFQGPSFDLKNLR